MNQSRTNQNGARNGFNVELSIANKMVKQGGRKRGSRRTKRLEKIKRARLASKEDNDNDAATSTTTTTSTTTQDDDNNIYRDSLDPKVVEDESFPLFKYWNVLKSKKKNEWKPTEIQSKSWSLLLRTSKNLIGMAPTGSGKTYAYGLPLLANADNNNKNDNNEPTEKPSSTIHGLILVPTRELALQVQKNLKRAIKGIHQNIDILAIYGGVDRARQRDQLQQQEQQSKMVICATPGRLLDLVQEISTEHTISWLILDEADRLATQADMSQQIDQILGFWKPIRTCLFSATSPAQWDKWMLWVGKDYGIIKLDTLQVATNEWKKSKDKKHSSNEEKNDHGSKQSQPDSKSNVEKSIQLKKTETTNDEPQKTTLSTGKEGPREEKEEEHKQQPLVLELTQIPSHVTQILHVCSKHKKPKKLFTTLKKIRPAQGQRRRTLCLVFFARIKTLQYIFHLCLREGIACKALHSHLPQSQREDIVRNFMAGKIDTLLATDVVGRGIHIPRVDSVINYDFPVSLQQYVHRCGRAGRSGEAATVYSFFDRDLKPMAKDVIQLLEETQSWVDPNLRELVDNGGNDNKKKKRNRNKRQNKNNVKQMEDNYLKKDDETDDEFASLYSNRIVLQRASHVSDASSSDDDSDDDDNE